MQFRGKKGQLLKATQGKAHVARPGGSICDPIGCQILETILTMWATMLFPLRRTLVCESLYETF